MTAPQSFDEAPERPDLSLPCFYLTTHRPNWLWDGRVGFPLMVSYRTLRTVVKPRPSTVRWALDSGGFMELAKFGRWMISPREYLEATARYDREIGQLEWCPPQDWMCEPAVIHGGKVGMSVFPGTHLSVDEHQRRTIGSFQWLTGQWPQVSDSDSPFMPVLQGWEPGDYVRHRLMYEQAGVSLADYPVVGIGSVCRRSSTAAIRVVVSVIGEMNLSTHWFGVKLTGIRVAQLRQGVTPGRGGDLIPAGAASLDSAAWSYDARRGVPLGGCAHPGKCSNCHRYAAAWRVRVLDALRAADTGPDMEPLPLLVA